MLKLTYYEPPYVSRGLAHFAGDMAVLEEIGEISEEAVEIIKRALGAKGDEIDLTVGDLVMIPVEELPARDGELILNVAKNLEGDSKLKILRVRG